MLTVEYIDEKTIFCSIWPSKNRKKWFLAKFGSPQFGWKCFWNTRGAHLICSIPFTWGIQSNKNLLPARCVLVWLLNKINFISRRWMEDSQEATYKAQGVFKFQIKNNAYLRHHPTRPIQRHLYFSADPSLDRCEIPYIVKSYSTHRSAWVGYTEVLGDFST